MSLSLERYGVAAVVVRGETRPIKDILKSNGATWLRGPALWMFPRSKKDAILAALRGHASVSSVDDNTRSGVKNVAASSQAASAAALSAPSAASSSASTKRTVEAVDGDETGSDFKGDFKVRAVRCRKL